MHIVTESFSVSLPLALVRFSKFKVILWANKFICNGCFGTSFQHVGRDLLSLKHAGQAGVEPVPVRYNFYEK